MPAASPETSRAPNKVVAEEAAAFWSEGLEAIAPGGGHGPHAGREIGRRGARMA